MDAKLIDPTTIYVVIGGVLVIALGLALRQLESVQKSVPLWLWSGLAGMLVGASCAAFVVFKIETKAPAKPPTPEASAAVADGRAMSMMSAAPQGMATMMGGGGGPGGMGGGPGGMGGAPGGMGGGSGGMGGGRGGGMGGGGPGGAGPGGAPRVHRDLTAIVGKIELLTRGLHLELNQGQRYKLAALIETMERDEEMTEEAAKGFLDAIQDILTTENAELVASIELPRPGRGGPGAGAAPRGNGNGARPVPTPGESGGSGLGAPAAGGTAAPGGAGGPFGGGGGPAAPESNNPFKQEENAKRLRDLRERIAAEK
jgi:hypothetical protein